MVLAIVGDSASGKSTLENILHKKYGFKKVISHTTRPIRGGEVNGVDYIFIKESEFFDKNSENYFIEIGAYNGWYYGSTKADYQGDVVAVLTPHGMRELKKKLKDKDFKVVYLDVPRRDRIINSLLRGDGSDNSIEEVKRRDGTDVGQYDGIVDEVDYVIENHLTEDFKHAKSPIELAEEIISLVRG